MAITDDQVAALRAQLAGRVDEHKRLLDELDPEAANVGYVALVGAAFFEAARRRFLKDGRAAEDIEIIDFVAGVRERGEDLARSIDAGVAETLIKVAIQRLPPEDRQRIDDKTAYGHQILLLAGLVSDEEFSSEELDEFMHKARYLGEEMLS
ncbi:hypothetical protein [Actinomadura sp. 3N407]|uniref:hypothetical protein n=1 Tax=Actinomadura sp. 3N407 TaxID=3457423 RepID=UPI003FCD3528